MSYPSYFPFKIKYVLPVIAFLITYTVIAQLYSLSLSENDLISVNAQVLSMRKDSLRSNSKSAKITFSFVNNGDDFFLFTDDSDKYDLLQQYIRPADTISILYRNEMQSILSMGSKYQIMKLEKDKDVLYSFSEARQTFGLVNAFCVFVMVGLWVLYFYFRRKLKLNKD